MLAVSFNAQLPFRGRPLSVHCVPRNEFCSWRHLRAQGCTPEDADISPDASDGRQDVCQVLTASLCHHGCWWHAGAVWESPTVVSLLALLCRTLTAGRTSGLSTVSLSVKMKCSSWIWTATSQEKPMTLMSGPGGPSGRIWRLSLGLSSSRGTLRTPCWWNPTATGRPRTTPRSICSISALLYPDGEHRERVRQGEEHLPDPPDAEGPLGQHQDDHHRRLHPLQHHDQDAGGGAGGVRWGLGPSRVVIEQMDAPEREAIR